jgi:hypothetical protein
VGWACRTNGERRNANRLLVGKPEGKRPLERPRRRRVDDIKMDLGEIGWGDAECVDLAQNRNLRMVLVNTAINFPVP